MTQAYWTSKLGGSFIKTEIERNERQTKVELDSLRRQSANRRCADCGREPTCWASVNLGVFLCIRCGSLHRGIGTHISKPKGCTGTYFWGPDEIDRMAAVGNAMASAIYGGENTRPHSHADDEIWRKFIIDKYHHRNFCSKKYRPGASEETGKSIIVHHEETDSRKHLCPSKFDGDNTSKSIAIPLPPSMGNAPVGDLLGFDAEVICKARATPCNAEKQKRTPQEISEVYDSTRQIFDEIKPTTKSDNFFAEFGL